MAILLDGKVLAAQKEAAFQARVSSLAARGVTPGLTVVLVGDDAASQVYVRNKERACGRVGIASELLRLPAATSEADVLATLARLNANPAVHGILVQLPLPGHIDERRVIEAIDPRKDVDGFHPENVGRLVSGLDAFVPCTPSGVMEMLRHWQVPIEGRRAVVIGRSEIVGKPMAILLLAAHATVTICHSRTRDLGEEVRRADLVVAAIGKARFVRGDWIREGAAVVDVGMNRLPDGKLCGDVDFEGALPHAGWISPVPGGVGLMTVTMLLGNTLKAAERAADCA